MSMDAGQILDAVILILLCVTIFYAARLSMFMNNFRDSKAEFDVLMDNLGRNIQRAEQAIATMRTLAATSGGELQTVVNDAKFLADELRFMNDAGDNLATRLEKLAERNRELIDLLENAGGIGPAAVKLNQFPGRGRLAADDMEDEREKNTAPSFFKIHDRDFDRAAEEVAETAVWSTTAGQDDKDDEAFVSQAERDLYAALQKGKKAKAGGVA